MRAGQAPLETADMDKPLIEIDLIPAEGDELGHPEPVPVGQQDHRVIPEPVPAHTPGRLAQASDFGGSQVLAGADVGVFMTLGKGELGHGTILPAELSCLRWLGPAQRQSAGSATAWRSIPELS